MINFLIGLVVGAALAISCFNKDGFSF